MHGNTIEFRGNIFKTGDYVIAAYRAITVREARIYVPSTYEKRQWRDQEYVDFEPDENWAFICSNSRHLVHNHECNPDSFGYRNSYAFAILGRTLEGLSNLFPQSNFIIPTEQKDELVSAISGIIGSKSTYTKSRGFADPIDPMTDTRPRNFIGMRFA